MTYQSSPIPYLGYRDANAAIEFLERAFGFEKVGGYEADGVVQHAELRCGSGHIMLGTDPEAEPPSPGHGVYLVVEDVDAHHRRAV
ncbi:MAG: VOC family protein, partial [Myxococcota bacterium]